MTREGNGKEHRNVEGKILRVSGPSCFRVTRCISRSL